MLITVVVYMCYGWVGLLIFPSSVGACKAPSGTMRASPQKGNVQVSSCSVHPSPVSKVCSVFSNKDLLSNSGANQGEWQQPILFYESLGFLFLKSFFQNFFL